MLDRPPVGRHAGEVLAVEEDLAGARLLEAGDHAHQRRLAAAGRPEEREELALVDDQRQVVDGDEVAEALGDVAELDEGLRRRIVPRRELPPNRSDGRLRPCRAATRLLGRLAEAVCPLAASTDEPSCPSSGSSRARDHALHLGSYGVVVKSAA